jgi:IclR family mhp operon transcriptional activator
MPSFPPVRAVERAIDVIQALNRHPVATLDLLHRQTAIPKPTLVRILETLATRGLVAHAPQYGAYCLTSGVQTLSSGYHGEPRIVEAAGALCEELTRRIKWPLALAVLDYDAMIVRYSTIPHSPLALLHSTLNMRLSLVARALGRAYLAFCGREECRALLDILRLSAHAEDALAHDRRAVQAMLRETRAHGYALREPGIRPVSGTLAVPVREGPRVVASLGVTWIASALTHEQAVERLLPQLQGLALRIERRLKEL